MLNKYFYSLFALVMLSSFSLNAENLESRGLTISHTSKCLVPIITTSAIIEVFNGNKFCGIVLIERGQGHFKKASLPGGNVNYGESLEESIRRQMSESLNVELFSLRQFHVYSDPKRDYRHHMIDVTHLAKVYSLPETQDDAPQAYVVSLNEIPWEYLSFDHAKILQNYLEYREGNHEYNMVVDHCQ